MIACSILQFVLSVIMGADLLKSRYSVRKAIYPVTTKYFWLLLTLAIVVLIGSIIVMQNSWDTWVLMTFVVAIVVGFMAVVRYTQAQRR